MDIIRLRHRRLPRFTIASITTMMMVVAAPFYEDVLRPFVAVVYWKSAASECSNFN
ncbi:hypothetical protein C2S51_025086 [Perilla frutescens var. frutescens]|nr:hypothetical protein C2S51_025086 [Perilla frutescens var. frutescens]